MVAVSSPMYQKRGFLYSAAIMLLIVASAHAVLTVDGFSFTPMTVDTAANYTLKFHSTNLSWIQATQIVISFDYSLYRIVNNQNYVCSVTTQYGTNAAVSVPSPICAGVVQGEKMFIRVTNWLVSQYIPNTMVTIVISNITNPRCTRLLTGINFQVMTVVNNLPIDFGITNQFAAVKNTIASPSLVFSTNKRFEVGTLTLTFTTATKVIQNDLVLVHFPYGIEIMYNFVCTKISGFSGNLIGNKLDEGVILIENGFTGSSVTSPQQFSFSLTGVLGFLDKPATDSIIIYTLDSQYQTVIDSTLGTETELRIQFEDIKTRVLCDEEMCGAQTSSGEKQALVDFYHSTNGANWLINTNWLVGDPCLNSWYGIMCNKYGQVIAIEL